MKREPLTDKQLEDCLKALHDVIMRGDGGIAAARAFVDAYEGFHEVRNDPKDRETRTVMFRYDMHDNNHQHPTSWFNEIGDRAFRSAWVYRIKGGQIFIFYEFKCDADKNDFVRSLPVSISSMIEEHIGVRMRHFPINELA